MKSMFLMRFYKKQWPLVFKNLTFKVKLIIKYLHSDINKKL
jgi:hypothetical protein